MKTDTERRPPSAGGLGFSLVALVVAFTVAGFYLDRWLHTKPWLMLSGVFVGAGLGFVYVIMIASGGSTSGSRKRAEDDEEKPDEDPS